jgi:hypothetical protein
MKVEVSICDAEGNPRPWREIARELEDKVVAVGIALYGNKFKALQALKIPRSTYHRHSTKTAKPKAPAPATKPRLPQSAPPKPSFANVVSDLPYLEAKHRQDPAWPPGKDEILRKLYAMRLDPAIIARNMEISTQSVERRLAKLGLRPSAYKHERENAL